MNVNKSGPGSCGLPFTFTTPLRLTCGDFGHRRCVAFDAHLHLPLGVTVDLAPTTTRKNLERPVVPRRCRHVHAVTHDGVRTPVGRGGGLADPRPGTDNDTASTATIAAAPNAVPGASISNMLAADVGPGQLGPFVPGT